MKSFILVLFLTLGFEGVSFSQELAPSESSSSRSELVADLPVSEGNKGTFQIQLINTRLNPSIPQNLEQLINENRSNDKVSYVQLGTQVRLKILPLSEVRSAGFVPLEPYARIKD